MRPPPDSDAVNGPAGRRRRVRQGCRALRLAVASAAVAVVVATTAERTAGAERAGFRELTPGVLTVVGPPPPPEGEAASAADTVLRGDMLDITLGRRDLAWRPLQAPPHTTFVERGRDREFPRDIWALEFAFKPPRRIEVEVPAPGLTMRRTTVWYLVYRVRNVGGRRTVIDAAEPTQRTTERFEAPVRFLPQFVLESTESLDDAEGMASYRAYLDRVIPSALAPIRRREDPARPLLDSAAMMAEEIPPGGERWGVATWEGVDPRIDFFSIYVGGLTNALRWRQRPGAEIVATDPPGAGLEQALQTLRLDFWRPGDEREEREASIGFLGMFERVALGTRLLDAAGQTRRDAAEPTAGLRVLGLEWSDLLDPADATEPGRGEVGASLAPLATVLAKLAARPRAEGRGDARRLFGDVGLLAIDDLVAAVEKPAGAAQRAALEKLGVTAEAAAGKPLESVVRVVRELESQPTVTGRRTAAATLLGPAAPRVDQLARQVALARALATLEALEIDPREIVEAGGALEAFEAFRPAVDAETDRGKRAAFLEGLFGPRGPALYAAAAVLNEGIDHAWVFRYEN